MIEKLLKIHRSNEQLNFEEIWSEGLFVFDSNVLLDLYRLPISARNDLMKVFESKDFNGRIWIGFQVAIEFINNRYEVIGEQKSKFKTVMTILKDALDQNEILVQAMSDALAKLKLKQRHSLINPDKFINEENNEKGIKHIYDFMNELKKLEKEQSEVNDYDQIKDYVFRIFEGKIGNGFDKKSLEAIYSEGEKRYDNKIPPGYKDRDKEGEYSFEDRRYIRKYGDLILWKEIIEKAKLEKIKYIVLVTGDVKEDWWQEKRGKRLGPRKELLNEIYSEAPDLDTFYLYDTSNFLQYAKKTLNLDIKDSSITEAKDLINLSRLSRYEKEEGLVYLIDIIKKAANMFEPLKVGIGKSVKNLPPIKLNSEAIYPALMEIFSNVLAHGINNYVGIQGKEFENMVMIRFKNLKKKTHAPSQTPKPSTHESIRGMGLESISKHMSKEDIDIHIHEEEKWYFVELYIPKGIYSH